MQRLCDKYNRAIDSIHQLVSFFVGSLFSLFSLYNKQQNSYKNEKLPQ